MGKWDFLQPCDEQVHRALEARDFKQAFEVLLEGYQAIVVQFCTTRLDDAADGEEVAQEVFVAIWRALPRYQPKALLRTWVFTIARYRCRKYQLKRLYRWRRGGYHERITDATMSDPPLSPADQYDAQADAAHAQHQLHRLERALPQLSKRERELLSMRYIEDLSFRDIARRQWRSEATVRRKIHAAEQRLRALLLQEEKHEAE